MPTSPKVGPLTIALSLTFTTLSHRSDNIKKKKKLTNYCKCHLRETEDEKMVKSKTTYHF